MGLETTGMRRECGNSVEKVRIVCVKFGGGVWPDGPLCDTSEDGVCGKREIGVESG